MPSIPRILAMLETELSKQLVVTYTLKENPGPENRFVFSVHVRNNSSIPVKNVLGSIAPTEFTDFPIRQFRIGELPPGEDSEVAVVQARVSKNSRGGFVATDVGTVTLVGVPDLSGLKFQERDKPMSQSRPTSLATPGNARSRVVRRRVRGIPLSPAAAIEL